MVKANWFYQLMGEEIGPYSIQGLQMLAMDGTLLPEMLVRQEGGPWRTAGTIRELFVEGLENDREFLGLLLEVTKDGKIDRDELLRLKDWLENNKAYHQIPAIASLIRLWNRITADRVVDKREQAELFNALANLLPRIHRNGVLKQQDIAINEESTSKELRQRSVASRFTTATGVAYRSSRHCRRCGRRLKTRLVLCYKCAP